MTNHNPVFTSSSVSDSFSEFTNTTDSTTLHNLSGTMNFTDSDHSDTHTTTAFLASAVLSSGSVIPASSLAHFQAAMTSTLTSDHNGSGSLKWTFADADDDFDFLSKNQSLVLTYDIKVSDNHGGSAVQTVKVTVTGTDDKPVINMSTVATVNEQTDKTLSLSSDTAHVALNFTDDDLTNTGHTATVIAASASGSTAGILPDGLGTAELMSFYHVDSVIKNSGSSAGVINTTFSAPDLAFDYLAAGEHLNITYTVQLDDHAGGVSTQTVVVTVVGTNDKPIFISGPETTHLVEDQNVNPAGNLTAHGDLFYSDVDLSDHHTVSASVTASLSGGGSIGLTNAQLLAFLSTTNEDSTGHVIGEVDVNFAMPNSAAGAIPGGQTLTLDYKVNVTDSAGATATQDFIVTILGTNHPVVITSGPESSTVSEQDNTTASAAPDTTPSTPAGTLNFTDPDTGDAHTVGVTLTSTSISVPAATQTDLGTAVSTVLHDSTGTGTGTIDWNFAIADNDLDFLSQGQTLAVFYNVSVSDGPTTSTQTVEVDITGSNDPVAITTGPQSASLTEQPDTVGSTTPDTTPVQSLAFTDVDLADVHSVSVALDSAVWSAGSNDVPAQTLNDLQSAILTTLHDSTGTGAGGIDWTFSLADKDLDFLNAGDTLTMTYDITVSDGITNSTQQVTVTATGTADPSLVLPASTDVFDGPFTDAGNAVAAGNAIFDPGDQPGDASTSLHISAVNGSSANVDTFINSTYGQLFVDSSGFYEFVANAALDALTPSDNPTETFNITVTNSNGQNYDTTLTLNIHGGDDAPVVTSADVVGSVTEDAGPQLVTDGDFEHGLTGWTVTGSDIRDDFLGLGGAFGNFSAVLGPPGGVNTETLSQNIATTAGTHYTVTFTAFGDPESGANDLIASWNGVTLLNVENKNGGPVTYSFDVVGDGSSDPLSFTYFDDGNGIILDNVSVTSQTGPATESTNGHIAFSDVDPGDTHTVSVTPDAGGYVGTFTVDPVTESGSNGSTDWHFTVNNADIQFLSQGQVLTQTYTVAIADQNGAITDQDIAVTLTGTNDAPTAVNETVVTDAGANGTVDVPGWALALNDTDPDSMDHVSFSNTVSASDGSATTAFGDAFFTDDSTAGGSFTYQSTDGIATSNNTATATVVNNATNASTLTAAGSGDSILIATNGTEALQGGSGNDVLIGNSGSHTMTGGGGNDTFAFLNSTDGPGNITDFNNTTQHDRIAVSANGFGGGLTAGQDVSSTFETSADNQFSGAAEFHFDTANQTLYFSSDGTQANAHAVTSVQNGVVLTAHDILVV